MRLAVVATLVALLTATAHAQEPSVVDRDAAREIVRRGAADFDNKEWEKAAAQFRRAYEIVHAPTLALMEARALVQLGRLVEASDAYSRAASQRTDAANVAFRRAQADASAELAALRPRIPSIEIVLPSAGRAATRVWVDGVSRASFALIPLDPGTHLVSVQRAGLSERSESVMLREAERRTIVFEPLAVSTVPSASPARYGHEVWMWAAFGFGAAGLTTGVVAGALAVDRKATLDRGCQGTVCPLELEPDVRDYHRLRTVSLVGYVAGFVGTAGGLVLLATRSKEPRAPTVKAAVSTGGFVVSGDF